MLIADYIDKLDSMYPSCGKKVIDSTYTTKEYSTTFGYVLSGEVVLPNGQLVQSKQYFSIWTLVPTNLTINGSCALFTRIGYKGQNTIGGPIEDSGRLCYIDGCSDSMLIYPPRLGDPSLNALFFPDGINQSFHIHPSIRLGVVAEGNGFSCIKVNGVEKEIPLKTGDLFCIEERELHRFKTDGGPMVVIPYHPDGDWGPTDHNHIMLNRTYIK